MKKVTRGNVTIEKVVAEHGEFDDFYQVSNKNLLPKLFLNEEELLDLESAIHAVRGYEEFGV